MFPEKIAWKELKALDLWYNPVDLNTIRFGSIKSISWNFLLPSLK